MALPTNIATKKATGTQSAGATKVYASTGQYANLIDEEDYEINHNDTRFQEVEKGKEAAAQQVKDTYGGIIADSDKFYQAQIDASKNYAATQQQLQQERTDFIVEGIEQDKDKANKDYIREQSGAYVDWQKQSNQYGVNAEQMAAGGLAGTGYSESSQVSMWNTYQNRIATARETFNTVITNYDRMITDAQLQNNAALAEIAYNAQQQQLQLLLDQFQYKNNLVLEQMTKEQEVDDRYYSRYLDVYDQINAENAAKMEAKKVNESIRQYNQSYELDVKSLDEQIRMNNEEIARNKRLDTQAAKVQNEQLRLQNEELKQRKKEAEQDAKLAQQQLAEEKRQFNASLNASKSSSRSSSVSSSSVSSSKAAAVSTDFYSGNLNSDASKYGTFGNGYQPKGISGHGKLSAYKKSGKVQYIEVTSKTLKGKTVKTTQKIWKAEDGTRWYWFGQENKYIQIK